MKSTKPVSHRSRASKYVYVDRFLCMFVYISFSDLVFEETQIGDPLPPQGTCIFVDIGRYFFMHLDSEQVVLEEHPIRVDVSEAPRPTITYSRMVSKNVILVLEFE